MTPAVANTMKAIIYGKDGDLEMTRRAIPQNCQHDKVLVRVSCAGLNPVDAKDVMGDKLPQSWKTLRNWIKWFIQSKTPGFDFSGQVVDCPSGCYKKGDYVFGTMPPFQGTLSEYIMAPLDQICLKPVSLSMKEAAALPLVGLTALQSISPYISGKEQESVLIIGGSGGTGHVAIQVAKALGAATVSTICSSRNAEFVKKLGATNVIDYTQGHVVQDLEDCVDKIGLPFDFVLDCVTSADSIDVRQRYFECITSQPGLLEGTYLRIGGPCKDWVKTGMEHTVPLLFSDGKPLDCWKSRHKLFWIRLSNSSGELKRLKDWADQGKLKPAISQVLDFEAEEVQSGFESILGRRVQGKIVVNISGT